MGAIASNAPHEKLRQGTDDLFRRGRSLFQRCRDRSERGLEVGAEASNHRNDSNRNTRSDEAIFNRGCSRFVCDERPQFPTHKLTLHNARARS